MRLTSAPEPVVSVTVRVTFLRMDRPPVSPARPLPADARMERVRAPTVAFYRYLYNTAGEAHLWWLRRVASDAVSGWSAGGVL